VALDYKEIRKTIIDTVKAAIGDDLTQMTNPVSTETYGLVMNARPNPEKPIPSYPYAVLDITGTRDTQWHTTNLTYDGLTDFWEYDTHKTMDLQITVYGNNATMDAHEIAEKLATSYRRDDIREILSLGDLGLVDVEAVQIQPELLQTDFLEVSVVQMSIRVNDKFVDPSMESIEDVILHGELDCTVSGDPLDIDIDTTV